jgi:hypothetical protein
MSMVQPIEKKEQDGKQQGREARPDGGEAKAKAPWPLLLVFVAAVVALVVWGMFSG